MKNISQCPLLKNNLSTLKETSKDTSSGVAEYMTESLINVVNFDAVKRSYLNELGFSEECAKSVDAIFINNGNVIFVEFKNGSVDGADIKMKVKDSLLIFGDITGSTLTDSREQFDFVLVIQQEFEW